MATDDGVERLNTISRDLVRAARLTSDYGLGVLAVGVVGLGPDALLDVGDGGRKSRPTFGAVRGRDVADRRVDVTGLGHRGLLSLVGVADVPVQSSRCATHSATALRDSWPKQMRAAHAAAD